MQRISAPIDSEMPTASKNLLDAVQRKLGMTPNLFKTLGHSPAALRAYLNQSEALSGGVLPAKLREQIAVAVAGANQCDYCASAHTLVGRATGASEEELALNLSARSQNAKTEAVLRFAKAVVQNRGHVSDAELGSIRDAGFSEAELVEIVAHVGMNIFTNYFNHISGTEIDFPFVSTKEAVTA